jgi:hypothetical protein
MVAPAVTVVVEDLTQNGRHKGMLALMTYGNTTMMQTSEGVPGTKHEIMYIAQVELHCPVSRRRATGKAEETYNTSLYKKIIATTSKGVKFVWMDETVAPPIIGPARQYGRSSRFTPMHWGQVEWEKRNGKRER